MDNYIHVSVGRCFDNRDEGLPDDSPRAVELHRLRATALHDVLDSAPMVTILNWGKTDAPEAHEFVEIIANFAHWVTQPSQLQAAGAAALAIGKFLATAAIGDAVKEGVKWIFEHLRKKQQNGEITNVNIRVTPKISVQVDPPRFGGRVYISVQVEGEPFGTGGAT